MSYLPDTLSRYGKEHSKICEKKKCVKTLNSASPRLALRLRDYFSLNLDQWHYIPARNYLRTIKIVVIYRRSVTSGQNPFPRVLT